MPPLLIKSCSGSCATAADPVCVSSFSGALAADKEADGLRQDHADEVPGCRHLQNLKLVSSWAAGRRPAIGGNALVAEPRAAADGSITESSGGDGLSRGAAQLSCVLDVFWLDRAERVGVLDVSLRLCLWSAPQILTRTRGGPLSRTGRARGTCLIWLT